MNLSKLTPALSKSASPTCRLRESCTCRTSLISSTRSRTRRACIFRCRDWSRGFRRSLISLFTGIGSIATVAYTYARIQWPTGRYLSQVPVDMFNFGGTGCNGRLLTVPEFIPKGDTVRLELGTQAESTTLQLFFEGAILIPQ